MTDLVQAEELVQRGIAAAKAGQTDQAQELLLRAVDLDEENEQAWLWLSGLLESQEEKRICLENVLAINPGNTYAQAGLEWLEQNAPPEPSEPEPDTGTGTGEHCPHCGAEIPPSGATCPHCHQPLLVACPNCGTYVDVQQATCTNCGRALGDFHEGANYHLELARAYLERGRNDLAEEAITHAEATAGDDPELLQSTAVLYEKTGHPDQAVTVYERAIALAPKNASLYASLGALYRERSQLEEAKAMYAKAGQLDGDNPTVLFELAQLSYAERGPAPDVLKMLQKVIQKQPMNAQAFVLLGDAYVAQERYRQARQQYTHACQLTSPNSEIGQLARRKLVEIEPSSSLTTTAPMAGPAPSVSPELSRRPGCITTYALLLGLGAALSILSIVGLGALLFGNRSGLGEVLTLSNEYSPLLAQQFTTYAAAIFSGALVISVINLAVAIGLWNMKNWARILEIIRQGLAFAATLLLGAGLLLTFRQSLAQVDLTSYPAFFALAIFVGFAIQAYFLFWFIANRERFH